MPTSQEQTCVMRIGARLDWTGLRWKGRSSPRNSWARPEWGATACRRQIRKKKMSYAQPRQFSVLQGQEVPDGVLVEQALAGDQWAFELLVSRYHGPLERYIRGFLKDGDEVYDVLQHVFLQLYVSLPILLRNVSLKP